MEVQIRFVLCILALCSSTCLGDEFYDDIGPESVGEWFLNNPYLDALDQAATMLHLLEAWSEVTEHVAKFRTLTPGGIQMVSGGLVAGVASRIFETDVISHGLKAAKIEDECTAMVACELGSYILHTNEHLADLLLPVYKELFQPTSKYWQHMLLGLRGTMCLGKYPSCKRDGYYMRR